MSGQPAVTFLPRGINVDKPTGGRWILLRGLVREARHWGDFPLRLADRVGASVHCHDLPGNGIHHARRSPLSIGAMLDQLHEEISLEGPVYLLGLSMGGLVVAEWASRYPDKVAGLVLINSSSAALSPPWQRMRPGALPGVLKALCLPSAQREEVLYRLTCVRQDDLRPTLSRWVDYAREYPVSRGNFLRQLCAAVRYRVPAAISHSPVLILSGRGDRLVDPRCSRALARHWQCRAHEHPWAGHDLPHDDPDWLLERLAQFRAETAPPVQPRNSW
ncbi:hypothetical protein GCM10009104_30730 [Marinobacterium maritimum]|uniref:AB hydrolase-1 domain-containing protein n=1 Tax=Marinobacterium maritimum TaxID=500162 RepID=A0ABN1I9M6_9GAMM